MNVQAVKSDSFEEIASSEVGMDGGFTAVRLHRGIPGPDAGHLVYTPSFFDRFWHKVRLDPPTHPSRHRPTPPGTAHPTSAISMLSSAVRLLPPHNVNSLRPSPHTHTLSVGPTLGQVLHRGAETEGEETEE